MLFAAVAVQRNAACELCGVALENTYKRVPYSVRVLSAKYRVQHENEAANLLLGERNACFAEKVEF